MFKLDEIQFNNRDDFQLYSFTSHSFVYGPNTVGKTALTKAIDFVLGSSEELRYQGLDNLDSIEAHIKNDKTDLWIKRSVCNSYFYKRTIKSDYVEISIETYKDNIGLLINDNIQNNFIEVYSKVFDEHPTFRSFSFLNYIDEKGLGDLSVVFTRGKDLKHQIRIRNIMDFFFNYENVEQIYEKELELEKQLKELKKLESKFNLYHSSIEQIKKSFRDLQLRYVDNFEKDFKTFETFKNSFSRKSKSSSMDLVYLSKSSFALAEEIKLYSFMHHQSKNIIDRKARIERLLSVFNSVIEESPEYLKYTEYIINTIEEIHEENLILSLTDYQKAIKDIQIEKEKLDNNIKLLKGQSSEIIYEDAIKMIGVIENNFTNIRECIDIEEIENLRTNVEVLKKEIKALRTSFNKKQINNFNKNLTKLYLESNLNVKHLNEDSKEIDFSLEFEPFKLCLFANHLVNGMSERFLPGSMARQTHLQILVYLSMFKFLNDNFKGFIHLPILVIDSANQPMGVESFKEVYPTIIAFAEEIGLQTLFLSKDKIDCISDDDFIDISNGLNKFHNQSKDKI